MPVIKKPANSRKPWTSRWQAEGKQREKSFATKREATDFLTNVEHSKRANTYADPKLASINFGAYAADWIAKRNAPATRRSYTDIMKNHGGTLASRTLAQVAADREGVQTVIDAAPSGCRVILRNVVLGPVRQAQRDGRITSHRLSELTAPRSVGKATCHMIDWNELTVLSGKLGPTWELLAECMWALGLRLGESLALTRDSFRDDPANGHICRVSAQRRTRTDTAAPKGRQAGDFRDLPVPGWLWDKVEGMTGDLFPAEGRTATGQRMRDALDAAGLESNVPHDLRHAFASHMLGAGIPLPDVARYLGHRDINLTYRTYSHFIPDSFGRARDAMDTLTA